MDTLPIFYIKVLQILARRHGIGCNLEDVSHLLRSSMDSRTVFTIDVQSENDMQAGILEALIYLADDGYIFLNSITDRSSITIKGMMQIKNKVFCN